MFSFDVLGNGLHRPRAVEGDHGVYVFNPRRLQFHEVTGHAGAIQLESSHRFAAREHRKGLLVVKRDALYIHLNPPPLADAADGVFENGEVCDAQKVKFDKSRILYGVHVVLRDDLPAFWVKLHRHKIRERGGGDDNACRVHRNMPDAPLKFFCHVYDFFCLRLFLVHAAKLGRFREGAVYGHVEPLRAHGNQF